MDPRDQVLETFFVGFYFYMNKILSRLAFSSIVYIFFLDLVTFYIPYNELKKKMRYLESIYYYC